ncbi:MAG: MCP four helix bundle domain-containing protein, partial [Rubrivivax sp.]|nr:MCP four helix bundle domain-containing protein [Rubrivivax sp.]
MRLSDLKLGTRLGAAFAIVLVLFGITTAVGISRLSVLSDDVDDLANKHMVKIGEAADIKDNGNVIASSVRNAVLADDADEVAAEVKRIADARAA